MPDCRAKVARDRVYRNGQTWVHMYCEHCGVSCGYIPERTDCFSWSQCDDCAEKFGPLDDRVDPNHVWFERVKHEQIDLYGRELSLYEIVMQLDNPTSKLSLLAKDRPKFGGT